MAMKILTHFMDSIRTLINDKQTMYFAVNAFFLVTVSIGMSYHKTESPFGLDGPAGTIGAVELQGEQGITGVIVTSYISSGAGINLEVTDVGLDSDGITH